MRNRYVVGLFGCGEDGESAVISLHRNTGINTDRFYVSGQAF